MKKILVFLFALMVMTGTSACSNTFDGAGRDMENWGESIQRTF